MGAVQDVRDGVAEHPFCGDGGGAKLVWGGEGEGI